MPGTVVVSVDAELCWGFHDQVTMPADRIAAPRASWRFLTALFEKYEIPATWAVVGHLCLDGCDGTHADHPCEGAWFSRDPGGVVTADSRWFAPRLVTNIRDSAVGHDIGLHAFSHVEFGAKTTTPAIADAELHHGVTAVGRLGITPASFVFPRNNVGHRSLLAARGFTCYRGPRPERWYDTSLVPGVETLAKGATYAVGSSPPIVSPAVDDTGLVNIPASLFLFSFGGLPQRVAERIGRDPIVRQVEAGLDDLRSQPAGVLHLWLHPNNITTRRDRRRMNAISALIAAYRDRFGITVATMADVAEQILDDTTDTTAVGDGRERGTRR